MRRSITLISAAVTTFSLVVLGSVVYAYRVLAAPRPAPVSAVADQLPMASVVLPAAVARANMSPQEAANAAAKFLNRADAFSVQLADFNGSQAYKVAFSSGDVVFVGLDGKILGTVAAPAQIASSGGTRRGNRGGGHEGGGSGSGHGGSDDGGETEPAEPGEGGD